jgi:hypothetical protein
VSRLKVAEGHFQPTPADEARCLREYGFDRLHLYALMVVVAAWRADQLPITARQVGAAVEQVRGVRWADRCLTFLEGHRYVRRWKGQPDKNRGAVLWVPTTLGLQTCPAPPAELAAE